MQKKCSSTQKSFRASRRIHNGSLYTSTILITGGTSGIGYQASIAIARKQPQSLVIIASRNNTKFASQAINSTLNQKNVTFLPLDLSNLNNVRTFASHFANSYYPPISHFVLNATLFFMDTEIHTRSDGFEATFEISHVGHALLFHLLFPHFALTACVRVTSSGTHDPAMKTGLPNAKCTTAEEIAHRPAALVKKEGGEGRYTTAKLCNVLWTYDLARRFETLSGAAERKLTVVAFDPGLVPGTALGRDATSVKRFLWFHILPHLRLLIKLVMEKGQVHSGPEAGEILAFVVLGEEVSGTNGIYFKGRQEKWSSIESYEVEKQEEL